MNKEEIKRISDMDLGEFYAYFVETVVHNREIWSLDEEGEIIILENSDEEVCIPFFATEDEALLATNDGWEKSTAGAFEIGFFINEFVPDVVKSDLKMALIKSDEKLISVDFVEFRNDIEMAYQELKGELGHPKNKRKYKVDFPAEMTEMRMEYTADDEKDFELRKPTWIEENDPLNRIFEDEKLLVSEGQVYYGALVMANSLLFEEGRDEHPGFVLYSLDPYYNSNPYDLVDMAWQLNTYVGTDMIPDELKQIVDYMEAETERVPELMLPLSMTGGREVYFVNTIFQRDHLPGGILHGKLFPILANPHVVRSVTILPKYYWSDNIVKVFIDDDVPKEIIDKDLANEDKIRKEIMTRDDEAKYRYFIKNAIRNEEVWTIRDGDYVIFEDKDGQRWLPLWPDGEFGEPMLTGELNNAEMTYFNVYEFSVGFTYKFEKLGWKAAVMWNDRKFIEKTFSELKADLEAEMLKDPDWQKD